MIQNGEYENTSVKYWTDSWTDLESFDLISTEEVYERYLDSFKKLDKLKDTYSDEVLKKRISDWNNIKPGSPVDIAKRHYLKNPKYFEMLYLEIPYQFYFDYMSDWLNGIAFKGVKEGHPSVSLDDVKEHIKNNTKWSMDGRVDGRSYHQYETFKKYGVLNPIFNNGLEYPKRSTHMTAYAFLTKSDVPILFKYPIGNPTRFKVEPNKIEEPYFKNKYLSLEIDIDKKIVDFFLEDEHIGAYAG